MAMGKRERDRQPTMWFTMTDLPTAASHPFYRRLNQLLSEHGLVMRLVIGVGTPRGLQGRVAALITLLVSVYHASTAVIIARSAEPRDRDRSQPQISLWAGRLIITTCTTGCYSRSARRHQQLQYVDPQNAFDFVPPAECEAHHRE